MIKAIIFDMDGVLIDSEPLYFKANVLSLKPHGIDLTKDDYLEFGVAKGIKNLYIKLSEKYGVELDHDLVNELKRKYLTDLMRTRLQPRPGAKELLDLLEDKYLLGLASSSGRKTINESLSAVNMRKYFKEISSGADVEQTKPFPDVYLNVAEKLCVEPESCVAIEDSESGVTAGKRAGMKVIAAPNDFTASMNFDDADIKIDSLFDINIDIINNL